MKILKLFMIVVAVAILLGCQQRSYKINPTGQTVCYNIEGEEIKAPVPGDRLYGQDANFDDGKFSFTDNQDGTVTDNNSGLTWQQIPALEGMTWQEAEEYCKNLELGGCSDWRLPSAKELFSISDFNSGWPYLDTTYFKLATGHIGKDEQFWTSNKYVGVTVEGRGDAAFGVNHVTGHIKAYAAGSMGAPDERGERGEMRENSPNQRPPMGQRDNLERGEGEHRRPPMGENGREGNRPPMGVERGEGEHRRPPMNEEGREQHRRPPMGENGREGNHPPMGRDGEDHRPPMREGQTSPSADGNGGDRPRMNPMAKHVRAVRGDIYGGNQFEDNGDGTVSDLATGLMWTQDDNGKGIEWGEALIYAQDATMADYTDWRLPNVKELQSIVDYSRAPSDQKIEAAIDPIFHCTPFVNEAGDSDFGYYWSNTSACFRGGTPYYFAWYVAFGRAVNNHGQDFHGAGAVRFDTKEENDIPVEGGEERYYNFVRLVRNITTK